MTHVPVSPPGPAAPSSQLAAEGGCWRVSVSGKALSAAGQASPNRLQGFQCRPRRRRIAGGGGGMRAFLSIPPRPSLPVAPGSGAGRLGGGSGSAVQASWSPSQRCLVSICPHVRPRGAGLPGSGTGWGWVAVCRDLRSLGPQGPWVAARRSLCPGVDFWENRRQGHEAGTLARAPGHGHPRPGWLGPSSRRRGGSGRPGARPSVAVNPPSRPASGFNSREGRQFEWQATPVRPHCRCCTRRTWESLAEDATLTSTSESMDPGLPHPRPLWVWGVLPGRLSARP